MVKQITKQKNNTQWQFKGQFKGQYLTILLILIWIIIFNILNWNIFSWGILKFSWLTQQSLMSKFSEIHFNSPWNDFGWWIFWLWTTSKSQTIKASWVTKTCVKQLKWIYYNAARWWRLRPLDQESLDLLSWSWIWYSNLSIEEWWLYTACDWNTTGEKYGIYWSIKYNRASTVSYIIAWVKLNYNTNDYTSEFANNFQYFNNQTPLWYIWDSVWWIWFIGWSISWDENLLNYLNTGSINDIFDLSWWNITYSGSSISQGTWIAQDTMRNILIQGNVILSKAIDVYEKKAFLGNLWKKTVLLNSADINSASIINKAKKNAEALCKGKTYFVTPSIATLATSTDSVLCYKNIDLVIDLARDSSKYKNKTIIMKNGNVSLKNSMTWSSPAIDLFIDWWNLYIQNTPENKENFNNQWYSTTTNITNSGILIKWNYIINWLLIWINDSSITFSPTTINSKFHLLWKTVILNSPTLPSEWRITQITELLWNSFVTWINLENVFYRQCWLSWIANDWTICSGDSSVTTTPFVLLNEKFPSKILQ